jgi:two-component system sensor kinase FixL
MNRGSSTSDDLHDLDGFARDCPHPILLIDTTLHVAAGNEAARRFFGPTLDARPVAVESLVAPDDRRHFRAAATLFAAVEGFKGTLQMLRADGASRIVDLTWFPRRRDCGTTALMAVDVDDLQRSLTALYDRVDRFEAVASASNEGWWDCPIGADYVHLSRRSRAILGIASDEEVHPRASIADRLPPDDRADLLRRMDDLVDGRTTVLKGEFRVRRDGEWRWLRAVGCALLGVDARPKRIVGTLADVTEERRSHEGLMRYRRLFEYSLDGLLIVDADGAVTETNEVGRSLCRFPAEACSAPRLQECFDDDANAMLAEGLKAAAANLSWNREVFVAGVDSRSPFELRVAIFPIQRDGGSPSMFGVLLHDVSLQKKAQRSDLEHREALAHVLRLGTMGEMVGGVAHELNQPLAAIVNYLEGSITRLRRGDAPPDALIDILERATQQAHLAGAITARMRQFIRKKQPMATTTGPETLIRETVGFIESICRHRSIAIETDLEPDLPAVVVDRIQIEQVLMNLASNAVDALDETPTDRRRLVFRVRRDDQGVVFSVGDTGAGVPDEWRRSIFEPFFSSKRSSLSLGLGLTISKSLVDSFGGTIWLEESPPDLSTVVSFRLPAAELPNSDDSVR